jgi:uncharacterized protein DUF998
MLRRFLLLCGLASSVLYIGIDLLAAVAHPEYHSFTGQTVSELMASGAPTEPLVDPLFLLYDLLVLAFAAGVWVAAPGRRGHLTAALLCLFGLVGLPGPFLFEMSLRGSGASPADIVHIAFTALLGMIILAAVVTGAALGSRRFRRYSYATVALLILFAGLTSLASRGLGEGEPTPWVGLIERADIGLFLLWVAALARSLLHAPGPEPTARLTWAPR